MSSEAEKLVSLAFSYCLSQCDPLCDDSCSVPGVESLNALSKEAKSSVASRSEIEDDEIRQILNRDDPPDVLPVDLIIQINKFEQERAAAEQKKEMIRRLRQTFDNFLEYIESRPFEEYMKMAESLINYLEDLEDNMEASRRKRRKTIPCSYSPDPCVPPKAKGQ